MAPEKKIILKIVPTAELKAHEETVAKFSDALASKIKREGIQRDPILVDGRSGVVLDGMHRLAAFKKLGIPNIVVCSIKYESPGVKLFRWYRAVPRPNGALFAGVAKELQLSESPAAVRGVGGGSRGLSVVYRGKTYQPRRATRGEIPDAVRAFDRIVTESGRRPRFLDEASLQEATEGDVLMLITPRFQKRDVIQAGEKGKLLPPKSTLHVFPLRPLGIDYPLEYLVSGEGSIDEHLAARRKRVMKGPALQGGRLYREPVLVFDP